MTPEGKMDCYIDSGLHILAPPNLVLHKEAIFDNPCHLIH